MENNLKQDAADESPDGIDHYNMTTETWLEVLDALKTAAIAGQLGSLCIALESPNKDGRYMIEHFGAEHVTDAVCTNVLTKLALRQQKARSEACKALREAIKGAVH